MKHNPYHYEVSSHPRLLTKSPGHSPLFDIDWITFLLDMAAQTRKVKATFVLFPLPISILNGRDLTHRGRGGFKMKPMALYSPSVS